MSSDILNRIEAKEKTCFTLDVFGKIIWKLQFLFEKSKPFIHFLNHRYLLFVFVFVFFLLARHLWRADLGGRGGPGPAVAPIRPVE